MRKEVETRDDSDFGGFDSDVHRSILVRSLLRLGRRRGGGKRPIRRGDLDER